MKNIVKIKRALISVSDKSLLENLLPILYEYKIEIISSGKTYKKIKKLGFKSIEISNFTGSNEMLGGRVKTLHPKIHAGILNIRSNRNHKLLNWNRRGMTFLRIVLLSTGSLRQKRRIRINVIIVFSATILMDNLRNILFPSSTFSRNKNRNVCWGYLKCNVNSSI